MTKGKPTTQDAFRRLALGMPEATEGAHMEHPDFRVRGKIFATLGYPFAPSRLVESAGRRRPRRSKPS